MGRLATLAPVVLAFAFAACGPAPAPSMPVASEAPIVVGHGDVAHAPGPSMPVASDDDVVAPGGSLDGGDPVGKAAPGFRARPMANADRVVLTRQKVTVLHFFATWCMPCQKSFPELDALGKKLASRGASVVALSVDDEPDAIAEFARTYGASFPVGWDDGHHAAEAYKLDTMPTTYVIDRDAVVRFVHAGYHDGEDAAIEREVRSLL